MIMAVSCAQLYREAVCQLTSAGLTNAANEAMWILEHTIGLTRKMVHVSPDQVVSEAAQMQARKLLERRASGEPIQYLLGTQEFWGLEIIVPCGVLIPRPDSELLIQTVIPYVIELSNPLLVDVGTGTGCLAVALGIELPRAKIFVTDRSLFAVQTAKHNAIRHHVVQRMEFCVGDLLSPLLSRVLAGKVAGIVANLPYISQEEWNQLPREVRHFEPRLALDGGSDGLVPHRHLLSQAKTFLMPQGVMVLEVGVGQAQKLCQEVTDQGTYHVQEVRRDALGIERAICLRLKE
jgi:release factor glutamine methyltransferase